MLFNGLRKQSDTTYGLFFMLIDSDDHITGLTGKAASVTVSLSKNGAAGGAPAGAISEVDSTNFPGLYKIAGNATDSNTLGPLFLHAKDADSDPFDCEYEIVNYDPYTFKPPVTLSSGDVTGNLPAQVKAQDNIDFGALQKASLNAATPSVTVSDKTGFSLSATGADLILKTSTFVQAIVAAINELATYGLTALNTLLVTTGIKTATTAAPADMAKESTLADIESKIDDTFDDVGDVRNRVDLILEDTGTTLPALLAVIDNEIGVIDGIVDAILEDTNVSIPALLATLATLTGQADILAAVAAIGFGIGSGPTPKLYTLTVDGLPCGDTLVVMTTDIAGANPINAGYTNALGQVTFYPDLPVGTTVYLWRYKTGLTFTNPDTEEIQI